MSKTVESFAAGLLVAVVLWASGEARAQGTDPARAGDVEIDSGSGSFTIPGGPGHEEKEVTVFYHRPESFTPDSPILLVIPGAGRNAWDYRDAWRDASEEHGVLVLSPSYPEEAYDFGHYHMGGLLAESNLTEVADFVEHSSEVVLDEERVVYEVNASEEEWIFRDFDRIFELAADAVGSTRSAYDLFGHSAGGQILHRLVLFAPDVKARRIVAANSGFYTLPDPDRALPFGLKDTPVRSEELKASFRQRLVLLLGGEDDHSEAGGIFLRSPSADEQGPGRRQRGRHFYEVGKARAEELGAEFNWEMAVVPGVGHEYRRMSEAAAEYLYEEGRESGSADPEDPLGRAAERDAACPPGGEFTHLRGTGACAVEVEFRNDGLILAGQWFTPPEVEACPATVFIRGSGESRRDSWWAQDFARLLVEQGSCVLVPDKRGSGRSGGDWRTAHFGELAGDALAGVRFAASREEVRPAAVGVMGLSQGGQIAPIVAARSDRVAFVVNVVGAAVPFLENVRYEMRHTFREEGLRGERLDAAMAMLDTAVAYVEGGTTWDRYLRSLEGARRVLGDRIADEYFISEPGHWRWDFFRRLADFDPLEWWRRVRQPVLVLYGGSDPNTPGVESAERLRRLFRETDHPDATVEVFPGLGHSLWDMSGPPRSHGLDSRVRRTLVRWLEETAWRAR